MVKIRTQIVTKYARYSAGKNSAVYLTIHQTGNTAKGANAASHANYQSNGGSGLASWHWTVDNKEAVQSYAEDKRCWHSGTTAGNNTSIGLEICVNSDGDYVQAVKNAADLAAQIIRRHGIPLANIVQHNKWSGKNCPTQLRASRDGITWAAFLQWVKDAHTGPTPQPPQNGATLTPDGVWGRETTLALQKYFGTPQDGVISAQDPNYLKRSTALTTGWQTPDAKGGSLVIKAMQKRLGVKDDGFMGTTTGKALQARYGYQGDGYFDLPSSASIKKMQEALNKGTF